MLSEVDPDNIVISVGHRSKSVTDNFHSLIVHTCQTCCNKTVKFLNDIKYAYYRNSNYRGMWLVVQHELIFRTKHCTVQTVLGVVCRETTLYLHVQSEALLPHLFIHIIKQTKSPPEKGFGLSSVWMIMSLKLSFTGCCCTVW